MVQIPVSDGIGYLRPGLRSVKGHPLRSAIFQQDPDTDLRQNDLTRYMNRADSPLHGIGRGSPQASLSFNEKYLSPRLVEGIFLQAAKYSEVKRLRSRKTISMNLFSDSKQSMEELLRKSKKVKRGATVEEGEIDGAWLTAHARIAWRCRDDMDLGVSRYPYELAPVVYYAVLRMTPVMRC
jgi:hypothetical protein